MKKLNIALIGLRFGKSFVPIYLDHPSVDRLIICDLNLECLQEVQKNFPGAIACSSLEEILNDDSIDAVHLTTPIPLHADQTVAVLESGKHCACTVPMATSLEDLQRIVDAKRKSGKNFMMMETTTNISGRSLCIWQQSQL